MDSTPDGINGRERLGRRRRELRCVLYAPFCDLPGLALSG